VLMMASVVPLDNQLLGSLDCSDLPCLVLGQPGGHLWEHLTREPLGGRCWVNVPTYGI
jgi:hypothetical protein